ncbi:MAG TPA: serine/threonine-protein kinase [Jatrophihabitantaceae bacterium]
MSAASTSSLATTTDGSPSSGAEAPRFAGLQLLDRVGAVSLYSARESGTGRAVGLKVIDESAPVFIHEALQREANYLAMLGTHPNIVTLYQRTTLADGRPALVLEACPSSAAIAVREQRLSVPAAVSIAIKIAGALETVHRAHLVHCAVRPGNVLLTEFDEPVLADFSAAVANNEQAVVGVHETTAHTAPELLLGDAPTAATDVYALTSTLYEMVAGRAAFRTYDRESPAAVSLRILAGGVRPIMAPDVPLELSDLLVWGLNADPAERPPGAAWLAEELGRIEQKNGWLRTRMVTGEPKQPSRTRRRFFF